MSVYRVWVDECERLWVLDSGVVNATIQINQVCPPKIVVFDLRTDAPLFLYELPPDQVKQDSLHSNIIVDVRNGRCHDAYAYITDVWRYGIVTFSLAKGRSWRTTHHFYYPNPEASDYELNQLQFAWTDGECCGSHILEFSAFSNRKNEFEHLCVCSTGVFGLSLSPVNNPVDRLLYFHPMSSHTVSKT